MIVDTPHEFGCGCVAVVGKENIYDIDRLCKGAKQLIKQGRDDLVKTHMLRQLNKERTRG